MSKTVMSKFIKNKLSFYKKGKKYHFHHFILRKENKKAIDSYNQRVRENRLFSDELRQF